MALIVYTLTQDSDSASPNTPVASPDSGQSEIAPDAEAGSEDVEDGEAPEEGGDPDDPTEEERREMYDELAELANRDADDPLALGDISAPLTMIIYSDFRCPYCGQWERETLPTLIDEYVDSGQMRLEWRDMAVLGDSSVDAALAARAAAAQGKFWEFASALYEEDFQTSANDSDYEPDPMATLAADVGLDRDQFLGDLEDDDLLGLVEDDRSEAWSLGFTGTPAFLIEGVPVIGAQPLETFHGAIQYRLEQLQESAD